MPARELRRAAELTSALTMLDLMTSNSIAHDAASVGASINAFGRGSQWEQALHFFEYSLSLSVSPTVPTYGAAIDACECGAQWSRALHLLVSMEDERLEPDKHCFQSSVSAFRRNQQVQARQLTTRWNEQRPTQIDKKKASLNEVGIL